ncbi:MAG: hypothetical protein ACFB21_10535 [Opitutales bacterium]
MSAQEDGSPVVPSAEPLAIIQLPPLKTFVDDLLTFGETALPPQEFNQLKTFATMLPGFPEFNSFVPDAGVTVVAQGASVVAAPQAFILVKLKDDETFTENARFLGLAHRKFDEWTVLSPAADALAGIEEIEPWVGLTDRPKPHEVTATFFNSEQLRQQAQMLAGFALSAQVEDSEGNFQKLMQELFKRLGNLPSAQIGLELGPDALKTAFLLNVREGSPEADLVNAEVPSVSELAAKVPAIGPINLLGGINYGPWVTYLENLAPHVTPAMDEGVRAVWDLYLENLRILNDANVDAFAGSISGFDMERGYETMIVVMEGQINRGELLRMVELQSKEIVSKIMDLSGVSGLAPRVEIEEEAGEIDGEKVIQVSITQDLAGMADEESPEVTQEQFYLPVDGNLLMASSFDELQNLAEAYREGVSGQTIAEAVGEVEGFAMSIDAGSWFESLASALGEDAAGMESLAAVEGEPIQIRAQAGNNTAAFSIEIGANLLQQIVVASKEMEAQAAVANTERTAHNNLRMIASAGQQYLLETGESRVSYRQLEGEYFAPIEPVAGEDYTALVITENSDSLSVTLENGTEVTYEF